MNNDGAARAAWGRLRATRWSPPRAAMGSPARRLTYQTALQQAEELFRAAEGVTAAAQPLPLFYGLSQAGRAIAAAASVISIPDGWELRGHGIKPVKGSLTRSLPQIEVATEPAGNAGSFVRLSEMLGSPVWGKTGVPLGELWDCIPENRDAPLDAASTDRHTPLYVEMTPLGEWHSLTFAEVAYLPPRVLQASDGRKALHDYLAKFPSAQGYAVRTTSGAPDASPQFTAHQDGWGEVLMHWRLPHGDKGTDQERLEHLRTLSRSYAGALYLFPAIGQTTASLHPLMAWWAVLHTLSMLARYQPAEWADHIDVNGSRHAVPIEELLRTALHVVPQLVHEAIEEVS